MERDMNFISIKRQDDIATIVLNRDKVNALNGVVVEELVEAFRCLEKDGTIKAVILTGTGSFFSFGFDIPEFLSYTKERFTEFLFRFTDFYTYLFIYPKPVIAALNGHTIAGGCMIALACDYRVMVTGKARISLNELAFGSTVFAGSTEMLRFWCGGSIATKILYSGGMFRAEEALELGLINKEVDESGLMTHAIVQAEFMSVKDLKAFAGIKKLLRSHIAEEMKTYEASSIKEFVDIWYSESTRENLKNIKIR
jgi:Delta3-Delta2-enoyl-CoA isomerase